MRTSEEVSPMSVDIQAAARHPRQALLHHRRGERAVRREGLRAALLGAGVHAAQAHEAPRQPPLLPAPRGAADPPHPRPAVRAGLHHQRRAQPAHRRRPAATRTRARPRLRTSRSIRTSSTTRPSSRRDDEPMPLASPRATRARASRATDVAVATSTTPRSRRWRATTWPSSSARSAASASSPPRRARAHGTSVAAGNAGVRAAALQTRRTHAHRQQRARRRAAGRAVHARPDPRRAARDPRVAGQLTTFFAPLLSDAISRAILRGSVGA